MKTTSIHSGSGASRAIQSIVAALGLAATSVAFAAPLGQVGVFISGEALGNGRGFIVDSGAKQIAASARYKYKLSGRVRGTADTPMAQLVAEGTPIGDFIDLLQPGASALLEGTFDNPGGNLPCTVVTQHVSGRRPITGVPGLTSIKVAMDIVGSIDANGKCSLEVTNVVLTAKPKQKLGSIKFMKGSKLLLSAQPTVKFSKSNTLVDEDAGTVSVPVRRSTNYHGAASVDFKTTDGTAKAGTDYVAKTGTVTFDDGETVKNISISILGNTANDGVRRFTIDLIEVPPPAGGKLVPLKSTTVTISDND